MRMVKVCVAAAMMLIAFAAVAVVARGADRAALQKQAEAKERQELDCLKSGDYDQFAGLIADDAVFLDRRGTAGKAEVVSNTRSVRLTEYTMSNIKFVRVSDNAEMLLYQLDETGTIRGNAFTAKVNISALWTNRGGKWVCLFSQETATK